jgi:hypothetical protein
MTLWNTHGCENLRRLFRGLDKEAEELAERLEFGDNESVLAWFRHNYPSATVRVVEERRWPEFVSLVRQLYAGEISSRAVSPWHG